MVAYRNLAKQAGDHQQLQRYTMTPDSEKVWVSAPYTVPAVGGGSEYTSSICWTNIGKFLGNVDTLPSPYMQIAWSTVLNHEHGQHILQFERLYLIWNKSVGFKKGHYIRVA